MDRVNRHYLNYCWVNIRQKQGLWKSQKIHYPLLALSIQKIGSLSGGKKTRLSIALLLVQNYNMLILDEPTTYLDVLSQRLILEALKMYQGAILIVSHNPEFLALYFNLLLEAQRLIKCILGKLPSYYKRICVIA